MCSQAARRPRLRASPAPQLGIPSTACLKSEWLGPTYRPSRRCFTASMCCQARLVSAKCWSPITRPGWRGRQQAGGGHQAAGEQDGGNPGLVDAFPGLQLEHTCRSGLCCPLGPEGAGVATCAAGGSRSSGSSSGPPRRSPARRSDTSPIERVAETACESFGGRGRMAPTRPTQPTQAVSTARAACTPV